MFYFGCDRSRRRSKVTEVLFICCYWFHHFTSLLTSLFKITNSIILGRAEAFAMGNGPLASLWDAVGNSLGYAWVLIVAMNAPNILLMQICAISGE